MRCIHPLGFFVALITIPLNLNLCKEKTIEPGLIMENQLLNDKNLEMAAANALSLLSRGDLDCVSRFYPYSGLKATARLKGNTMTFRASDGFKAASQDALTGLALNLFCKILRRSDGGFEPYIKAYEEFSKSASAARLHNTIRSVEGKKKPLEPKGTHYDLNAIVGKVAGEYWQVFDGVEIPHPTWSEFKGRLTLAFHDGAFGRITVSALFDSPRVPQFVLEYLAYHEMLHAKHDVKYARGKSMRRTVHTHAFKLDEKKFAKYEEANGWISRNLRYLR